MGRFESLPQRNSPVTFSPQLLINRTRHVIMATCSREFLFRRLPRRQFPDRFQNSGPFFPLSTLNDHLEGSIRAPKTVFAIRITATFLGRKQAAIFFQVDYQAWQLRS